MSLPYLCNDSALSEQNDRRPGVDYQNTGVLAAVTNPAAILRVLHAQPCSNGSQLTDHESALRLTETFDHNSAVNWVVDV
jgi:hypothetical protein